MKSKSIALAALVLAGASAAAVLTFDVLLATKNLGGGTDTQKIDASSTSGQTKLVGKIVNKTGRDITDLTISVTGDKTDSATGKQAPTSPGGSSKATRPGPNGGHNTSSHTPNANGNGYTTTIVFDANGVGKFGHDETLNLDIDISDAGTASDLTVKYTPSTSKKPQSTNFEADMMATVSVKASAPGGIVALDDPGRDRSSTYISNMEEPGKGSSITKIDGTCLSLPSGIALSAVYLQNPSASFATPAGTTVSIDGASFSITGFTALGPGEIYDIVVVLTARPTSPYKIMLDATY